MKNNARKLAEQDESTLVSSGNSFTIIRSLACCKIQMVAHKVSALKRVQERRGVLAKEELLPSSVWMLLYVVPSSIRVYIRGRL
ncbi:hypothetical protein NC653_010020 [Populus alba x Populus x berolinensis]|uniref:Uncharacterized protein n=1 Tax=Populus alba x Populus x berolinensis TaxID=444605 RepID=A0AAD6RAX4_9ROSI|nr:hypothetical protein NC653_010020 [Populus alba x Populus x berolinensis]